MWNKAYSIHSSSWSKFPGILKLMKSAEELGSCRILKADFTGRFIKMLTKLIFQMEETESY